MKTILLIGANFVNRGAEAMLLTALTRFRGIYPDARFIASSYAKTEASMSGQHMLGDMKTLSCRLISDPINVKKLALQLIWVLVPLPGLKAILCRLSPYLMALANCDLVVDLSGFALSDRRPPVRRLVYVLEVLSARSISKPFVAFTQAFGPFKKTFTRILARICIPRVSLLLVRGMKSLANIHELSLKKLPKHEVCADSAFLFESSAVPALPELNFAADLPIVGLSPNINIARTSAPEIEQSSFEALVAISQKVIGEYNCNLLLFCHEGGEGEKSDRHLLELLSQRLGPNPRVLLLNEELSASALRALIARLEFLVASRFHALVGAISTATPFLGIAWAHKYFELAEEAGVPDSVIDSATSSSGQILARFEGAWQKRQQTRLTLQAARQRLVASAARAFAALKENIAL